MRQALGAKILALPTPVWVVGAFDQNGDPNAMTAAWCGVDCSKPPCLGVSLRAATYTHGCIMARKAFTLNIPSAAQAREVDYFGMASGRDARKLETAGMTWSQGSKVDAPCINEFPITVECRLAHTAELGLHTRFTGEIMEVWASQDILDEQGRPDMALVEPLLYNPGTRLYAKAGDAVGSAFSIGRDLI
ncbi:MAG: hypothetical protein PWQ57_2472 [Desulfovibrionales bacterium]|jgi:flavin reductase (DIM6/NTAB) family NADH-FMN oxidoreductase RutF|nr:hypothetical protein [Desulfovibrionales bacterium]